MATECRQVQYNKTFSSLNVKRPKVFARQTAIKKPNDLKKRRTPPLTSRCCILYIYSTNTRTEYFKNAA